jgi:hypothetical protein
MATSALFQPTTGMSSLIAIKASQIGMSAFGLGQFLQGDIVSNGEDRRALSVAIANLVNRSNQPTQSSKPTRSGHEEVYFTITLTNPRLMEDGLLPPSDLGWRQLLDGEIVTSPEDRKGIARFGSKLLVIY